MAVNDEIFGKRLSYQMQKQKISIEELSVRAKVAESAIKRMMAGQPVVNTLRHQRISNVLGLSSGYMVGEHDDKNGPVMTGRRSCIECGADITGKRSICRKCSGDYEEFEPETERKRYDHLPGTMREAVEIERLGRLNGGNYGTYAPIFDGRKI